MQNGSFPIVAIGASAGGLEAYTDFFHALPPDTGMGFVLIQHLDPTHHSLLTEIISKATGMPVEEVKSGVQAKPNRVYVIPHNALITIVAGAFRLTPRGNGPGQHLAVNLFMRSLAQDRKSKAIGVVLSGTGADGTSGLEEIKAEGGVTFVQDPATAKYDGMPRSAIDSGCADFVLAPKDIAKELGKIKHHPFVLAKDNAEAKRGEERGDDLERTASPPPREKDFVGILGQLRKTSGVDFSQYKPNTIHRRALRRMVILKLDSPGEYAKYLKEHPEEGEKLFDDVLIPVTSFFRDFEAFEALKTQVYPAIVKDKSNKGTIRMWAPGCSTGEETYSLAMTLLEFLGDRASSFQVQIFGTDLNEKGIQHARAGLYGESIAEEISPERMQRFFVKTEEGYRVNKAVRDMCVFARQNLANDPPFSQMNVVACRNLLIYIQPVLQKKIIPILHYALKPSGFLVLGSSESVSAFPDLFSTVDKKHKIYGKKAIASRLHYDFAQSYYPAHPARGGPDVSRKQLKAPTPARDDLDVQAEADRVVLKNLAPVGVVINSEMEVVQYRGRTTPYLEAAPGKPSLNVLKLARNGLAIELRTLIAATAKKGTPAKKDGVPFDGNGHRRMLNLSVWPLGEKGAKRNGAGKNHFFLVLFDDVTPLWTPAPGDALRGKTKVSAGNKDESRRLKQELAGTRDALRSSIESEEALKEEFQSANEEILSANEELQSTNEELETSKEELQSANEELNTLNAELRNKNTELHDLSNDISNFMNSTRIPVVMLDRRLRIRRLTPTADKLLKVLPSDIGRPLSDIRLNIEAPELEQWVAKVFENLQPAEREVRDLQGHWHGLNILPYRTQDNKIDGVVLALQDIDAVKSASEQLRKSTDFFKGVVDTVREPLLVLDSELRVRSANQPFLSTFKVSPELIVNRLVYDLGNGQWNIPKLRPLLEKVLPKKQAVTDFEMDHDFENIGKKTMLLNARSLVQADGSQPMILLAVEDITERKQAQAELVESEERFRTLFNSAPMAVFVCDRDAVIQNYNRRAVELWGREPAIGIEKYSGSAKLWLPNGEPLPHDRSSVVEVLRTGVPAFNVEMSIERPDGSRIPVLVNFVALKDAKVGITGAVTSFVDITERKLSEAALIKSEKLAAAGRLAATLAHEINNPLQAVTNLMDILRRSSKIDAEDRVYADMAAEELRRVTHLTRQSLSFYRETTSPVAIDMEDMLKNILDIYAKQIEAKKIVMTTRYEAGGARIDSYPGAIRQVLSTLLVNAMEAVRDGGTIAIRVRKSFHGKHLAIRGVRIAVADNGSGITPANLSRIFEPFFTTKGERGTGLGHWVAQGIMNGLGGTIGVRSSAHPGKSGTCFSIFLPSQAPKKI